MSCCEKGTSQVAATTEQVSAARPTIVLFQYVGNTRLMITGPATRKSYRFDRPGARVMVDGRDQLSLSTVPVLRVVGELPA
jgi:hypothetical protein